MAYADYGKGLESPLEDNSSVRYNDKYKDKYKDKFNNQQIRDIRSDYLNGLTQRQIADNYGIHLKAVYNILHLHTYPDSPLPNGMSLKEYQEAVATLSKRKRS